MQTTSDKVVKSTYNDNGVEVDNMYLDNVAALRLYNHGTPVFAHDFRKQEFQSLIPKDFLSRSILVRCISPMLMPRLSTTMSSLVFLMLTQHTLSN